MTKERVLAILFNENSRYSEKEIIYKVDEIKELIRAADCEFIGYMLQNKEKINPKYYVGSGKVKEIKEFSEKNDIDTVIFNHELTGSQIKNLEDAIDKKIIDRTGLILDIFAKRAKTKESKLQVKLAQLEYRLPRLVGFRNYLSREGAGIGTKGPGEQKLESDRRTVQREINSIKNSLKNVVKRRNLTRNLRKNSNLPIISLIGYSNSGKSTILNQLSKYYSQNSKKVYEDDMLFATLETYSRFIILRNGKKVIVNDTVGFISDLPTSLVESFKSTLEEIDESDLIINVVDRSNPNYLLQVETTNDILKDKKIPQSKILYVFNKMDKLEKFDDYDIFENQISISALDEKDISLLSKKIEEMLYGEYKIIKVLLSYKEYHNFEKHIPESYKSNEEYRNDGIVTYLYIKKTEIKYFKDYIIE